jgi:16S rRNA (cytosine967-C5)-methyltransferase
VLRRFQREHEAVLHAVDRDVALRTSYPRWFVEALRRDHGHDARCRLQAGNAHPPLWLRVNRRRSTVDRATGELTAAGFTVESHPFAPDAIKVAPPTDVRSLPGFLDGRLSVQDAAAQLAVELLEPQPGERILDACAAPGGKTSHVLERTTGPRRVLALDVSDSQAGSRARKPCEAGSRGGHRERRS